MPVIDWLPWNHTFGGNHNIGLTLFNGGSMYLDEGKPMPGGIEETVKNLREISSTVYFNVPRAADRCCLTCATTQSACTVLPVRRCRLCLEQP
jgi:acyl-CoA synthetase (AMP-forming)/AMP-acid ligase II